MSTGLPPLYTTEVFNPSYFRSATDSLTLDDADARYLRLGGNGYLAALSVGGLDVNGAINASEYYQSGTLIDFTTLGSATSTISSGSLLKGDASNSITVPGSTDSGVTNRIIMHSANYSKIYYDQPVNKLNIHSFAGTILRNTFSPASGVVIPYFTIACDSAAYGDKEFIMKLDHASDIMALTTTGVSKLIIGLDNDTGISNTRQFVITPSVLGYNGAVPAGFDVAFNAESGCKLAGALAIGDSTDSDRLISALDSTGTLKTIAFGRSATTRNQAELTFEYVSSGSSSNRLSIGFFSAANLMNIFANGFISIGSSTSYCPLYVANTTAISFGTLGATVYRLRTDNGVTETATGPINYNVSIHANGYVSAAAMAMTSDRRLKRDITPLSLNHIEPFYQKIQPVSYRWRPESSMPSDMPEVGLIAQDLVSEGYMDLVSATANSELLKSCENDQDDIQLGIRYDRISVYNMKMIQSLMQRIDDLERMVSHLS